MPSDVSATLSPAVTPTLASQPTLTSTPESTATPPLAPTSTPGPTPTPPPAPAGYSVHIAKGLHPTWTAEAAAADAYASTEIYQHNAGEVLAVAKIISVDAVAGRDVPKDLFGCCEPAISVRWIVHAQGTFFNTHGGPSPGRRMLGTDGWYLYEDDGTGRAVGFAFNPLPADLTGDLAGDPTSGCTWLVDAQGTTWQVQWPAGWQSSFNADGSAVLLFPTGQEAARAGSTIGVTGSVAKEAASCTAAQKLFAANAIVYFSFGPED